MYIGIDPGIKGAIAVLDPTTHAVIALHDMPTTVKTTTAGKTRNRIDVTALHEILSCHPVIMGILIEDVCSRPGEGAVQAFGFGHGLGCIETVARLTGAPVRMVAPRTWKGAFGLTADKGESRHLAQAITGDLAPYQRAKDDGRAEAVLMALYGALNGNVAHLTTPVTAA